MRSSDYKYEEWYADLKSTCKLESYSVKINYMSFVVSPTETVVSVRDLSKKWGTSSRTLYKFFEWGKNGGFFSKQTKGDSVNKITVISFTENQVVTLENANESKLKKGCDIVLTENQLVTPENTGIVDVKNEETLKTNRKPNENQVVTLENTIFSTSESHEILSKIKNKKVIELLKEDPETISRLLPTWYNSYQKRKKKKEEDVFKSSYPEYAECVDTYWEFFKNRNNDATPMIDAKFGRNMNSIITALRSAISNQRIKTPEHEIPKRVLDGWRKILNEWDNYSEFINKRPEIEAIKGNYSKIIGELTLINNGKSTSTKQTTADKRKQLEDNYFAEAISKAEARSKEAE